MKWLSDNLATVTTGLMAAGFFCGMMAHVLPAGRAQRIFAALAHLLPANLVGAIKTFVQTAEAAE